jgi:hypothetical protein
MRRSPYPPSLRHRIKPKDVDARARREHARKPEKEARAQALTDIKMKKMLELFDHYGIDPRRGHDAWRELAQKLSEAHVPGMSVNRSGRPRDTDREAEGTPKRRSGGKLSKQGAKLLEISAEAMKSSASISASVKAAARHKGSALHSTNTETARKAYSTASGAGGLGDFLAKPPRSNRRRKK